MNSKKAKQVRRMLKEQGVDWSDSKPVQQIIKDHEGNEKRNERIFQDPKGGRAIYQAMKNLMESKRSR
jgi:hypothetical protein|tara:strand:- start:282 stop:485 length:204 start_codon:yes stop_codon:yes gene_type:complete